MVSSQGTFSDSGSWVWASSASSSSSICPCKAAAMVSTRSWRPANKGSMRCVQDVNEHLIQQTKKTSGGSKESFAWTGASTRMKVLHREDSLTMAQHGTTGFVGVWCVCAFWIFLVPFASPSAGLQPGKPTHETLQIASMATLQLRPPLRWIIQTTWWTTASGIVQVARFRAVYSWKWMNMNMNITPNCCPTCKWSPDWETWKQASTAMAPCAWANLTLSEVS